MQNNVEPDFQGQLDAVFAQLNPQAVEEFYIAYREWSLQQRINELRQRIETVRAQQAENEQRLREVQPSAIALAALARLQSNGVSDIALLDAMLERGESWLDQTMQRLDYFEQFDDFISDDYTRWCQGALEGAFDWIDSLREGVEQAAPAQTETPPEEEPANSEDAAEVEALFLRRLATEHEDDLTWQEAVTLKRPAIQPSPSETVTNETVEQKLPAPENEAQPDAETWASEYVPQDETASDNETAITPDTASPTGAEEQILPETASPVEDSALSASEPEQPALIEFSPLEETMPGEDEPPTSNEQPPLIESAPVDEPLTAEDEFYAIDEQPTLVEFATPLPTEATQPGEISEQETETEQGEPSEAPTPEDVPMDEEITQEEIPTNEEVAQSEENGPQETEQSAPEEAAPYEERVIPPNQPIPPVQSNQRKTGLLRGLIRLLAGS